MFLLTIEDGIFEVKAKIFDNNGIPADQQHLSFGGDQLIDGCKLKENKIVDGCKLFFSQGDQHDGPRTTHQGGDDGDPQRLFA